MVATRLEAVLKRDRLLVAASVAGLCLLSWLFLIHLALQMHTMDGLAARMMGMHVQDALSIRLAAAMSPSAAAHANAALTFVLATLMWAVMMIGMMLPSAAPTILLFSALERKRVASNDAGGRTASFITGYIAVWSVFSIAAAAAQMAMMHAELVSSHAALTSTVLVGAIFIGAGLYEVTPLKDRCLTHCRSPLEWIPRHMRPGRVGAFRMGVEHGAYCVGCCWVLMLLLFAVGVMNLIWVASLAAIVLIQKLLPGGVILPRLTGVALGSCGIALVAMAL